MAEVKVYGTREAIAALRRVDASAQRAAVAAVKRAAQPLASAIAAGYPTTAPLSGWAHKGRTGWGARGARRTSVKYGGRKRRSGDWPLVRVQVAGAAASIYDLAATGHTPQGEALVAGLPGSPSRVAWPTAERMLPGVQAAVAAELKRVEADISRQLRGR